MNNLSATQILEKINKIRLDKGLPKDEKVKPLGFYELKDLPKIPDSWQWVLINDISEFITNGVHTPTSNIDENHYGLKCLRITDLQDYNNIDYDKLPYCLRIVKGDYDKILRKNDIYFSFTGNNLGKRYIVREDRDDVVFAHYFVRWRPILVDPYYVFYVTHSKVYDYFINGHQLGSAQSNLKVTDLKRFPIPLCDLMTQKKISKVLKLIDDKIELNNKINDNLHEQCSCLYNNLVEGTPEGKLADVIESVETGSRPKGGAECNGVPSIGAEKIERFGIYDYSTEKYINESFFEKLKRGKIQSGDVLLYKDGAYTGKSSMCLNAFPYEKAAVNEHVFLIRSKNRSMQSFIYYSLQNDKIHKKIYALACGKAAQPGLNQQELLSVECQLPSISKIIEFENEVAPFMNKIAINALQNKKLAELRDTLLPKLMSGEIDVSNIKLDL